MTAATLTHAVLVYPISPWLKELIDVTLRADHYVKILIGMNMVVEGLALAAFHNMRRQAFGHIYVRETIASMHPDDREDVAQFAYEAVKGMVDAQGGVDGRGMRKPDPGFVKVCENAGIELQDLIKGLVEEARPVWSRPSFRPGRSTPSEIS